MSQTKNDDLFNWVKRCAGRDFYNAIAHFAQYFTIACGAYTLALIALTGALATSCKSDVGLIIQPLKHAGQSFQIGMISFATGHILRDVQRRDAPAFFVWFWGLLTYGALFFGVSKAIVSFDQLIDELAKLVPS
ncbi:MAG: hypothetical protein KDD85_02830 [Parvularculaceae bacterium]|nr:hypothetical protein [Parvularculaceae bacterium]